MKERLDPLMAVHTPTGAFRLDHVELTTQLASLHPDSFGWAMACCGRNRDTAEDVLHDAYMLVLDGTARFDGRSALRTWLFGVIRRVAISQRRREVLRAALRVRNEPRIARPSESEAPDDHSMQADRSARTRNALRHLSARQSEVLQLVFYHDMSLEEAAMVMGVALGSARVHYHRGKVRMAALLASDRT